MPIPKRFDVEFRRTSSLIVKPGERCCWMDRSGFVGQEAWSSYGCRFEWLNPSYQPTASLCLLSFLKNFNLNPTANEVVTPVWLRFSNSNFLSYTLIRTTPNKSRIDLHWELSLRYLLRSSWSSLRFLSKKIFIKDFRSQKPLSLLFFESIQKSGNSFFRSPLFVCSSPPDLVAR